MFSQFLAIMSWIISIILFAFVPDSYNYEYCLTCFTLFAVNAVIFLRMQIKLSGWLNFHLFFVISFLLINLFYPIVIYPINPKYFFIFEHDFNYDVINKATAIATIGILSYFIAVYLFASKSELRKEDAFYNISITPTQTNIIMFITAITFGLYVIIRGPASFFLPYSALIETLENSPLMSPLISIFQCGLFVLIAFKLVEFKRSGMTIIQMIKSNKITVILIAVILLLYFIGGSRTLVFKIVTSIACLFSLYIKRISGTFLLVAFFCAFVVFGIMSRTRDSDNTMDVVETFVQDRRFIDLTMDFVIVNRNLYLAVEEVDKNGYSYGLQSSKSFFSFLPFYPALVHQFGLEQEDIDAETFYTNSTRVSFSVGSNMIGNLYLAFGLLGIVLGMFLLGYIISLCQHKAGYNIYWLYSYTIFISYSLIYPRFDIFVFSRTLIWGLVIINLVRSVKARIVWVSKKQSAL